MHSGFGAFFPGAGAMVNRAVVVVVVIRSIEL